MKLRAVKLGAVKLGIVKPRSCEAGSRETENRETENREVGNRETEDHEVVNRETEKPCAGDIDLKITVIEGTMRQIKMRCYGLTYYLVDTENVANGWQPFAEDAQAGDVFILFYSKNVAPVSMSLFGAASMRGVRFDFVECRVGTNAMDFQLVTELGRLVAIHPGDEFVILSKDHGYDVVVRYWQDRNIGVKRESLFLNTPERAVRYEYESLLSGLGLMGKELHVAVDIFMQAMKLPQNERKIKTYNSFQKHYGAKEGRERYRVVKDLVKDLAIHGPFPQTKGTPAKQQQETEPASAADEPGKTPEANSPAKAQQAEMKNTPVPRKRPSVMVKERCPSLSKTDTIIVTNAINNTNQHGGSEAFYMQKLQSLFAQPVAEEIFQGTKDLLHPLH